MSEKTSFGCVLFLVLVGVLIVLRFSGTWAAQSDEASYMNSARLLARLQISEPVREIPGVDLDAYSTWAFAPTGFRPGRNPGALVPVYPPGYPLHLALVSWLFGFEYSAAVVNAIAFAAAALLLYLLALRLGLQPAAGVIAVVVFTCFPYTILAYTRVMSDGLATAWCIAALFFAFASHDRRWLAVLAGFAYGIAVLIRPTSLLLGPALLVAVPTRLRTIALLVTGSVPVALFLGIYNQLLYGAVLTTGYSAMGSQFSSANLWPCITFFASWLTRFLSPIPFLLAAAGAWWAVCGDRRVLALLLWVGALTGLYSLYWHSYTGGWYRLRFLLPALPAVVLVALIVASEIALALGKRLSSRLARVLLWSSAIAAAAWPVGASLTHVISEQLWRVGHRSGAHLGAVRWMEDQVEPSAVIVTQAFGGSLYFYTSHPIIRLKPLGPKQLRRLERELRAAGVPVYALLTIRDEQHHKEIYANKFVYLGQKGGAKLFKLEERQAR